ncbi:MAG TPA: class I SAM-dependent methyltransferase [Chitinophaga sp.]|uniref:class I SAM-dependent methyltransferase n=1 Tax=Chitinophaga sp. TaxID=1869181 RepID=UPI002DBBAD8E|nr:class I SAM-dependent methyltransferase [Chitinophaga sp.]HEU4552111.1 class I SAM-dependent methyltransferase [Chitinophaga sp.]
MDKKIIKPYSEAKRNTLSKEEFLLIERDFHDRYAEGLNWNENISETLSYERDEYGVPVEDYFRKMLGDVKGKKILDIGSGHGNTALNLAVKGAIVTSIDIAPKLIEGCKHRAQINKLDVDFRVMNACELEFADNTFDIILGFRTIHHLPNLEQFYKEAQRCLKKGGFLLVVEPQKYNPFVEIGRRFIKNDEDSRTPTEHPIVPKDIRLLKRIFGNIEKREFEFLKAGSLFFKLIRMNFLYKLAMKTFTVVDNVLWYIPFLRPMYWQVVIKAIKQ